MRALFSVLLLILAGTLSAFGAAKPAQPVKTAQPAKSEEPAMRVVVVRSNEYGCEPACSSWISAEGQITTGSPALFRAIFRSLGKTGMPVLIASGGGDVDSAIAIGRMIRERKLDVVVGHTRIDVCLQGNKDCDENKGRGLTGAPVGYRSYCASACSFILAAGTRRIVPFDADVGVHQIVSFLTTVRRQQVFSVRRRLVEGKPVEVSRRLVREKVVSSTTRKVPGTAAIYERIARYLKEMGIADSINPLMRSAPPESMHWMTGPELIETRIRTDSMAAFQVVELANLALRATLPPRKGGMAVTTSLVKPLPATIGPPSLSPPSPAVVPTPLVKEAELPSELVAESTVEAGRFQGRAIRLNLRFNWSWGGGSLIVAARAIEPAQVMGLTVGTAQFNVTVKPGDAKERALIPRAQDSSPTLYGHFTRAEFCRMRRDHLLRVAILPGTLDVTPETDFVNTDGFKGMDLLTATVCHTLETAARSL